MTDRTNPTAKTTDTYLGETSLPRWKLVAVYNDLNHDPEIPDADHPLGFDPTDPGVAV